MTYKIMFMALLAMCACAFLVSQADDSDAAVVASGTCGTNLNWEYDDATTTLTISGNGTTMISWSGENYVPWGSYEVQSIIFETPNLTNIGKYAFVSVHVRDMTLPSTIIGIEDYAFRYNTYIVNLDLPDSVTTIGTRVFDQCSNLELTKLPTGLTRLNEGSFRACSSITISEIPTGITTIPQLCFGECTSIAMLKLPDSLKSVSTRSFYNCTNLDLESFPSELTSLAELSFSGCSLKSLTSLGNITSFGKESLARTGLIVANLSDEARYIGDGAFRNCNDLTSVYIPQTITTMYQNAFINCSKLSNVEYNAINITSSYAVSQPFNGCGIRQLSIGEEVQRVPEGLFYQSSTYYTYLKTIYWNAIHCADFGTATVSEIRGSVTTIIFGDNVEYIPANIANAFKSTLTSVSFNDGLESIGAHAFDGCTNLAMVGLPDSVTEIGQQAFYGCTGILMPNLPSGIVNIHTGAFSGCPGVSISYLPTTIEMIGKEAFRGCTAITQMLIPVGFDGTIGVNAFTDCTELSKILNLSELDIQLGSEDYGHIAYYADEVRNNIGSTAIVQQKQNVVHEVIEKSDAASKLLRVLPALMAIAVISFLCGLFYYRETERNRL